MTQFDDGGLAPELRDVAERLRKHRHVASALELDQAKNRIMQRATGRPAARGGVMRKRSLLTAAIMFAAIGTGSAAALAVSGARIPLLTSHHSTPQAVRATAPVAAAAPNAAAAQYGDDPTGLSLTCTPAVLHPGQATTCTAKVVGPGDDPAPTGVVTFTTSSGQSFMCTLAPTTSRGIASCSVTFVPRPNATRPTNVITVIARYPGAGEFLPSSGQTSIVISRR